MTWWVWLAGGLALLAIELVTPSGFFVMFFGLAALTVGGLAWIGVVEAAWLQWLLFTALSVTYLLGFRGKLRERVERTRGSGQVDSLLGEVGRLSEPLVPGANGRVELRGSSWQARNDSQVPLAAGQRCRVVRVDGLTLGVVPE
jgi:membrane protein implicated in regulation of membrane protease activity